MITLLELAAVCARQRAAALDLFEQLGAWITDTPPGAEQRRWATWCHRHATHAELWAARAPALREFSIDTATDEQRGWIGAPTTPHSRAAWYASVVAELSAELDDLAAAVDPELDPSTARTLSLVRADLAG